MYLGEVLRMEAPEVVRWIIDPTRSPRVIGFNRRVLSGFSTQFRKHSYEDRCMSSR
jgi:hypothetical protein